MIGRYRMNDGKAEERRLSSPSLAICADCSSTRKRCNAAAIRRSSRRAYHRLLRGFYRALVMQSDREKTRYDTGSVQKSRYDDDVHYQDEWVQREARTTPAFCKPACKARREARLPMQAITPTACRRCAFLSYSDLLTLI